MCGREADGRMRMTKVARPPPAPAAIRENEDDTTRVQEERGPKCQLRLYDLGKDENADDDAFLRLPKLQSNPDSLGMRPH